MSDRQQLSLEQQFELRVFESQVRQLSREDAQELLILLREEMLHQKSTFGEILKELWGIGKDVDISLESPAEN